MEPPFRNEFSLSLKVFADQRRIVQTWFNKAIPIMVLFCALWDAALVVGYWSAFKEPEWFKFVLPLAHLTAGIVITYFTLACLVNRTIVEVDGTRLTVRHEPIPWKGSCAVDIGNVVQLYCDSSSTDGNPDNWVYNLNVLCADGRKLKLPSWLDKDQAHFCEHQFEQWLGIEPEPVPGEAEKG